MSILTTNYYELFGLQQNFQVELKELESVYHVLQQEHHPDKFAGADESQKMQAVQATSFINSAYETLKSPLLRAGYLLTLRDVNVESVTQADLGMDLLMEQMQMREALADLPVDASSLQQLDSLRSEVQAKIRSREQAFVAGLSADDLTLAKKVFHEMQFLFKLLAEINAGEEQRLGY
ncbi:MAG: Fe-S protein assembly co-chaperone HscB [Pseudohongiellaceae bacterium]